MLACLHTHTLAACALVSRHWSQRALTILWGCYADYRELISVAAPPENSPVRDDITDEKVCDPPIHFKPTDSRAFEDDFARTN
jgi:hypothetical protein